MAPADDWSEQSGGNVDQADGRSSMSGLVHEHGCYLNRYFTRQCSDVVWLGSRVVRALHSGAEGPGFKSQPRRCRVTVFRQTVHTRRASIHQTVKLVAAL